MGAGGEVLVGAVIAVGLVGVLVPVLPGLGLVWGAIVVWALVEQRTAGWVVMAAASALLVSGTVLKYLIPGRRLRQAGVPWKTTVLGGVLGVVGFFVIPVVGLLVGFVLGVYLAERQRLGGSLPAWRSTRHALAAAGWSIVIELTAGMAMALAWLVGVFA
jgi:uncharacterized protein YqgC (DUF456 family)